MKYQNIISNIKKSSKKLLSLLCISAITSSLLCGCNQNAKQTTKSGFYFDTIISITLYGTNNEQLIDDCFTMAMDYEQMLSTTIEGSDIYRINENPGEYVSVNKETISILEQAIKYCELSDGAFDITIGKLSDLWNFSEVSKNATSEDNQVDTSYVPADSLIQSYLPYVNYENIKIKDQTVMITDASSKIDLGGIAKGYIADRMKAYLQENNVTSGFIDLGGNILCLGPKKDGSSYKIGIQEPFAVSGTSITTVNISNESVVTSGVYERYFRVDDEFYHHILDTKTGYPVENDLYSVTIIANSSLEADALSTTCFSLGIDEGMNLIESLENVEAIFITNNMQLIYSSGLES